MDTEFFENRGVDMDVDTEIFKNRGVDMDMVTEIFENRGVDMDMDTAWNRCPPNSARNEAFDNCVMTRVQNSRSTYWKYSNGFTH